MNGVIAKDNNLPWNIKEEMQHFVKTTINHDVLMGRKTWDSLYQKPLKHRKNIVLSHQKNLQLPEGVLLISDLNNFIKPYQNSSKELIVIGGREVFDLVLPYADELIVSYIKDNYVGDIYAPNINSDEWHSTSVEPHLLFDVVTYVRNS